MWEKERFGKEVYRDNLVELRDTGSGITAYVYTEYRTPYFGKPAKDWLCAGSWNYKNRNGMYCEIDGIGFLTGNKAETIEGIAQIVREQQERKS